MKILHVLNIGREQKPQFKCFIGLQSRSKNIGLQSRNKNLAEVGAHVLNRLMVSMQVNVFTGAHSFTGYVLKRFFKNTNEDVHLSSLSKVKNRDATDEKNKTDINHDTKNKITTSKSLRNTLSPSHYNHYDKAILIISNNVTVNVVNESISWFTCINLFVNNFCFHNICYQSFYIELYGLH